MTPLDSDLNVFQRQYWNSLFQDWRLPTVLYHYTSVYGLQGIVETSRLYATHYLYMNDGKEIKLGDELAVDELNHRIVAERDQWIKATFEECIGKKYSGPPSVLKAYDYDIYIVSFSEDGNLLDQWRAYGDDGEGYSIGINPENLAAKKSVSVVTDSKSLAFIKVEYDETKQKLLIKRAVDIVYPLLPPALASASSEFEKNTVVRVVANYLSRMLVGLSLFFKHPSFNNEKEWRVVRIKWGRKVLAENNADALEGVNYRPSNGILAPYLKLDFRSSQFNNLLPLENIILGPKHRNREHQAIESLRMLLHSKGYKEYQNMPQIEVSELPYQ